jgi:hypothetical protein
VGDVVELRRVDDDAVVAAAAAVDRVGLAVADADHVIASPPEHGVPARERRVSLCEREHGVGAGTAVGRVDPDAREDDVVSAPAADGVVAIPAADLVPALAAEDGVVAVLPVDDVRSEAAVEDVVPEAARDRVAVRLAEDGVVAVTGVDGVRPAPGEDAVVPGLRQDQVVLARSEQRVVAVGPFDHGGQCGRRTHQAQRRDGAEHQCPALDRSHRIPPWDRLHCLLRTD